MDGLAEHALLEVAALWNDEFPELEEDVEQKLFGNFLNVFDCCRCKKMHKLFAKEKHWDLPEI